MDDAAVEFRIRVVLVSTRAAIRSVFPGDDDQLREVVTRANELLDEIERDADALSDGTREKLVLARAEIASLQAAWPVDGAPRRRS